MVFKPANMVHLSNHFNFNKHKENETFLVQLLGIMSITNE